MVAAVFIFRGCGGSHGSAAKAVSHLVTAIVEGREGQIKDAYGINGEMPSDLKAETDAATAYYNAHGAKDVNILRCDTLFERGDYSYVFIAYNLDLENDQEYPCVGTYMTQKIEGKYYVLSASKINADLRSQAQQAYEKFMTSETYKTYTKSYETFLKKNPGYEEKIAARLAE